MTEAYTVSLAGSSVLIGQWGSADANDSTDWLGAGIEPLGEPPATQWDEQNMTCKGLVAGVKYNSLTSYTGQVNVPEGSPEHSLYAP